MSSHYDQDVEIMPYDSRNKTFRAEFKAYFPPKVTRLSISLTLLFYFTWLCFVLVKMLLITSHTKSAEWKLWMLAPSPHIYLSTFIHNVETCLWIIAEQNFTLASRILNWIYPSNRKIRKMFAKWPASFQVRFLSVVDTKYGTMGEWQWQRETEEDLLGEKICPSAT